MADGVGGGGGGAGVERASGDRGAGVGEGVGGGSGSGRVLGRRVIHAGKKFAFEMVRLRATARRRAVDGAGVVEREMVRHPGAVCVLGLLGVGGWEGERSGSEEGVVLIRNHRFTVDEVLWEIPAGGLEPGEAPAVSAVRELEEETGYTAGRVEKLASFLTTPGLTDEWMHAFVARDLREVGQRLEPDEEIEVRVVGVSEALAMARDGRMVDGKSMLTLLLAEGAGVLGEGGGAGA